MDIPFSYIAVGVAVVLVLIGFWQRAIENEQTRKGAQALNEAKELGTHKAIAQFPHIEPLLCLGCGSCVRACPEDGVLAVVDGLARVVNGSRCIGHAKCEEVCPVGAIKVSLGDVSSRADVPVLSENLETNVAGLFIAGELGGIALIRNAIDQGVRAMTEVGRRAHGRPSRRETDPWDVVIVGAGPAGLAAGLKGKELGLHCLVIDQETIGGTIRKYPRRKLVMVQATSIPLYGKLKSGEYLKEDLISLWEDIIDKQGLLIREKTRLEGLEKKVDGFQVNTSQGTFLARFVILALGRRGTPRKLEVPGEEHEKVLFQLSDAAAYNHKHILIVGGGDSAVEAALALVEQPGNTVTISYRKGQFTRLKKKNEDRLRGALANGRVKAIFHSEVLFIAPETVSLHLGPEVPGPKALSFKNDFVFIFAGGEPPFPLLKQMGINFGKEQKINPAGPAGHR